MPAKIRSSSNLSQNPQEAVIATYICFLTNFTELELTNIQADYCALWTIQPKFWVGHAHPAHAAAPPCDQ